MWLRAGTARALEDAITKSLNYPITQLPNPDRLFLRGDHQIVCLPETILVRRHGIDIVDRNHRDHGDATAGQAAPRALGGAFAVVGMEGAVEMDDCGARTRSIAKRLGDGLGHRLVLHALREIKAVIVRLRIVDRRPA